MFQKLPENRDGSSRSRATIASAASRAGNAAATIRQVTSCVQQNTGIRIMATPGARSRSSVHKVVPPCRVMPVAARKTPAVHSDSPGPGE